MKVILTAMGNPDKMEDPYKQLPGMRKEEIEVFTFSEASRVCREFIAKHELGTGNWDGEAGEIQDDDGYPIARISYNGRAWEANNREKEIVID